MARSDRTSLHALTNEGFATLDTFLDPAQILSLLHSLDRLGEASVAAAAATRIKRGVAFAQRNLLAAPFIRAFIQGDVVQSLLAAVVAEDAGLIPVRAILFDKTGDANWTVPWHQDRSIAVRTRQATPGFGPWSVKAGVPHVQPPAHVLQQMVTLRFSLDPCGNENGPLRVIPQTHHGVLNPAEIDRLVASREQVSCTTGAGGVVIMRPLILHASSPAKRVEHRRVLHIEFGPRELPGGVEWAFFDGTQETGRRF